MDMNDLAKNLFGSKRAEGSSSVSYAKTIQGTVVEDSEDGKVKVVIDGDCITEDGTNEVEIGTVASLKEGDETIILLEGGGVMRPTALGSVGWGDIVADAASEAQASAIIAAQAADSAQASASTANTAANSALTQLSIVEDVAGTLDWISKHGTYTVTSDTTVVDGKVYFTYDGTDYTPIVQPDPTKNPHQEGWYVLDVTDSQSDFIMAHLAVTSRGLWVLPSGIGTGTTPASGESQADSDARQGNGYKLLLSNSGMTVYDATGAAVATYGASGISFGQDRTFFIGDDDAYIFFDADGHITIGGSVTLGSSHTLSELLAAYDTAALSVVIQSSAGTGFRNQTGSTTLTARVYQYGDNELDISGTSFTYKWYKNGTAVSGGTSKTLTVNAPSTTDTYKCEVTV